MVKNIIVIGASYAGHGLVNSLVSSVSDEYRILLVERNEFVLHPIAVVRAAVVPGWEEKNLTARITQDAVFRAGSPHRVIAPSTVVELKKSSIVLDKPFEGSTEVPFEKCIIATGSQQSEPMRAHPGATAEEYKKLLRSIQAGIKAANKILVVGGGSVGVEVTGEITSAYPDKEVTLVHNDAGLLHPTRGQANAAAYVPEPSEVSLSDKLAKQLRARRVNIVLNDRAVLDGKVGALGSEQLIPLESGQAVKADYVFVAVGNKPNSGIVAAADPGALTSNGYVRVDETFHVVASSEASPLAGGKYYALGDVSAIPVWKTSQAAGAEAAALGAIIAAELKGKTPKAYNSPTRHGMLVTLGPNGGAGDAPMPFFGVTSLPGFVAGMKSKDFFAQKAFYGRFQGSDKVPVSA